MTFIVDKEISGGICHTIHQYVKANNKYMKDYDQDVNNLYGWAMSQKLPVNGFEWVEDIFEFNKDFIKSYNEESDEGYLFKVDVQNPEKLHEFHNGLPFLLENMEIKEIEMLATNFHDKTEYVIHIRYLKQALNHGLVLKKNNHRVIKFNQNA